MPTVLFARNVYIYTLYLSYLLGEDLKKKLFISFSKVEISPYRFKIRL